MSGQIAAHNSADDAHAARFGPFLPMIGGGGSGELEDLRLQGGRLVNAGAGWQTHPFPRPFAGAPAVLLQPVAFPGWAEVKDVTAEGFSYRLVKPVYTPGSQGSVTTGSYYTANGSSANSSHAEHTLVSGVTLPTAWCPLRTATRAMFLPCWTCATITPTCGWWTCTTCPSPRTCWCCPAPSLPRSAACTVISTIKLTPIP